MEHYLNYLNNNNNNINNSNNNSYNLNYNNSKINNSKVTYNLQQPLSKDISSTPSNFDSNNLINSNSSYDFKIYKTITLIKAVQVNDSIVHRPVILSSSNNIYIESRVLQNNKYGSIVKGYIIKKSNSNNEVYKLKKKIVLKKISKKFLEENYKEQEEDPLKEMIIMSQFQDSFVYPVDASSNYIRSPTYTLKALECFEDNHYYYMVLPFIEDGDLLDLVQNNGPLSEDQAKILFYQLLIGLKYIHSLGIAHHDLSLENILYDKKLSQLYLFDFGAAISLPYNTLTKTFQYEIDCKKIYGKKNYIAPEIYQQLPKFLPLQSDLWSAGIILFILLTGTPPFERAIYQDERFKFISQGRLNELCKYWNLPLSDDCIQFIQRILVEDPYQRPSLDEILHDKWLQDAHIHYLNSLKDDFSEVFHCEL